MTRQRLLLLFCFLQATGSFAQRELKTGLAYARFAPDYQTGLSYYTEWSQPLRDQLALATALQLAYGQRPGEFPYYLFTKFAIGPDVHLMLARPVADRGVLRVGIGPSARYFAGKHRSDFVISDYASIAGLDDGTYGVPLFYPLRRSISGSYVTAGFSLVAEGQLRLTNNWLVGVRAAYQAYLSRDRIVSLGVNVGYRLP